MSLKHSPLHEAHAALGARFVEFGGFEMPLAYPSGTLAEHLACRRAAVVFDVSHLGTVRLEGGGSLEVLQRAFTNDLHKISPGRAQYTHLLDSQASVLDDCIVWWVADERFDVMPNASNTANVREAIGGEEVTASRVVLAVQGPAARERLATVSEVAAHIGHFAVGPFRYHGAPCIAAGTGYTGEDGVECALPVEVAGEFFHEVLGAGILPAGLGARDTLRLEACLPLHGHELGPGITPLEAGLSWVVAFDKGPFTGREALLAQRAAGLPRRLRPLLGGSRRPFHPGERCLLQGEEIGELTSGNYSPVLRRGIALGFVASGTPVGNRIEIETRGQVVAAAVVKPPFHRLSPEALHDADLQIGAAGDA